MAATNNNMNFDVNLLPTSSNDHNLGSVSLKWNLYVNQINGVASATTTVAGLMSAADKTKLDGFEIATTSDIDTYFGSVNLLNNASGVSF